MDLTNAFTAHIANGETLDFYLQSIDCVEHSVPSASLWSINQARAYSQLNMIMAVIITDEAPATDSTAAVKDVTRFIGPQTGDTQTSIASVKDPDMDVK